MCHVLQESTLPVAVDDPGSMRHTPYDCGSYSHAGRGGGGTHQSGVRLPADVNVRTNEGLANIQPASTGIDSPRAVDYDFSLTRRIFK